MVGAEEMGRTIGGAKRKIVSCPLHNLMNM